MSKGTSETIIPILLIATLVGVVGIGGLTTTLENAFEGLNFNSNFDALKDIMGNNVKGFCKAEEKQKFPGAKNFTLKLERIQALKIAEIYPLWIDKYKVFRVKYGPNSKKGFKMDKNGLFSDYACDSIKLNGSAPVKEDGWMEINNSKIHKFRVLEKSDKNVRIQVLQVDE